MSVNSWKLGFPISLIDPAFCGATATADRWAVIWRQSLFGRGCVKTKKFAFCKKYFPLGLSRCDHQVLPTTLAVVSSHCVDASLPLWKNERAFSHSLGRERRLPILAQSGPTKKARFCE